MNDTELLTRIHDRVEEIYALLHDPDDGVYARIRTLSERLDELKAWRDRLTSRIRWFGGPLFVAFLTVVVNMLNTWMQGR